jgi:hypothetical protein
VTPDPGDRFEIVAPPAVQPLIDALSGRRAGLQRRLTLLARDPCSSELAAYRLSGPLEPVVCGIRLDRGYRLAFTTQPPLTRNDHRRVVLLYVGRREPGHRTSGDIWDILHDLFGVENPPAGHHKPPCCENGRPEIDHDALAGFLRELRRFRRGR